MCGITGAIWSDPSSGIDQATLQRMTDVLRHRGPDDQGHYVSDFKWRPPYEALPGVALGFRRLSIIDLATGRQPMSNEDGSVWVVFNGEIYNFRDLRHRLEGAGHTLRTQSDTETIVHLYEDEGTDCFKHLNGMFAIAIWDSNRRRLVLARDRLGEKPVVYRADAGRLLFASELKSILEVPGVPREIDPNAVDEYLTYQYIPHPNTIFRGMRKLPPGHYAVWQDGRLEVHPYWQPDFNAERRVTAPEAAEQLRELFASAVKLRMHSDVPLGAFLSGGIDSSLVVAQMQRLSSEPIRTFTIGFPVKAYDETAHARRVAEFLGTEHQEAQVTPNAVEILPKLIWHFDEPFADSSAVPTWYLSQMTRQKVTVSLTGDGGDELFAGYSRYKAVRLGSWFDRTRPVRSILAAKAIQSLPGGARQKSLTRRLKRFSAAIGLPPQRRYLEWIAIFNETRRAELYADDFVQHLADSDPLNFLKVAWKRGDRRDPVTSASLADLVTYLPCDLMTKVDIASMAHSLECRPPFLDHRLVEFAASLPIGLKYRMGRGKRLLREAFADWIPHETWKRSKMGFGVPLDHWFRHELKPLTHDVLLDPSARTRPHFRPEYVARLVQEHESSHFDHSYRLWALVIFELWMREWGAAK